MAIIGLTIGVTFALSLVAAPVAARRDRRARHLRAHRRARPGGDGRGALGSCPIAAAPARTGRARVPFAAACCATPSSLRLNLGIFALHAVLMALFVVVPLVARARRSARRRALGGLPRRRGRGLPAHAARSWPCGASRRHERAVFLGCGGAAGRGHRCVLAASADRIVAASRWRWSSFSPPSTFSRRSCRRSSRKAAPRAAKGAASGVYSSVQFLGTFVGGAAGGAIAQHFGPAAVLVACLALAAVWLAVAWPMRRAGRPRAGPDAPVPHEPQATNP